MMLADRTPDLGDTGTAKTPHPGVFGKTPAEDRNDDVSGMPGLALMPLLLALAFLLLGGSHARAEIYGFTDKNGVRNFSNYQVDKRYKIIVYGGRSYGSSQQLATGTSGIFSAARFRNLSQHPNLKRFEPLLARAAIDFSIEVELLKAVMTAESGFNPLARSNKGAVGLMQIMPATAARYGLRSDQQQSISQKLTDPETNIRLGARYLSDLTRMFPNRQELILASYNAGENAVIKYNHQIPPYEETRNYVQIVSRFYQLYSNL